MSTYLNTPQEILSILSNYPEQSFFINELIRLTGKYPNSVQQALNRLLAKKLVCKQKQGNRIFYQIAAEVAPTIKVTLPLSDQFNWIKLLNRPTFYAFNHIVCKSNRDLLPKRYGVSVPSFWLNGLTYGVYYIQSELALLGKAIARKLETVPDFAQDDIKACKLVCETLINYTKDLSKIKLSDLTNPQIAIVFDQFLTTYKAVFPFITTPHAIERYFETKIREQVQDEDLVQKLLTPITLFDEERDSALKVAALATNNGKDKHYEDLLTAHWQSFCWLSMWMLTNKPLAKEYFMTEIEDILQKTEDPGKERQQIIKEDKERKIELDSLLKSIQASNSLKQQVWLLQEYINLRTYRKNALCQAHYYILPILTEIAKRLSLDFEQLNVLSFDEFLEGIKGNKEPNQLTVSADKRRKGWGLLMWKGKIMTPTRVGNVVKAMEQYRIIQPMKPLTKIITGRAASLGKAIGKVKIIQDINELDKVKKGDILVAKMTTPDFVIAMRRCAGIVTDEGGVTCHAAIVSREFGIPCLIATHVATKQLNDNDVVELNADGGFVRVLETENNVVGMSELVGKPLYKGQVTGQVKVVMDAVDFPKVQQGDIVVTNQTTPDFLSCLYRAGGLIVDEDSLTSHAVLYAKALKIPAIMGTKITKSVLRDGQIITLDADRGRVSLEK